MTLSIATASGSAAEAIRSDGSPVVAIVVFLAALALITTERVHRTKVALIGAAIVVLAGALSQEQAILSIDFNTIGLLAGMMIIVRVTQSTGVYDWLAIRVAQLSRGRSLRLVVALTGTTALASAFLDNLTTVLLVVPVTLVLADTLDIDPIPLVTMEVIASNIGGAATLIGDPPNIIIAGATGLTFVEFLANMAPIAVIAFAATTAMLYLWKRSGLRVKPEMRDNVALLDARASIQDAGELKRTVPILALTIVIFFVHGPLGLEPATVALTGAALTLLVSRRSIVETLGGIEWPTLFFFLGLFVLVGGLTATGVIDSISEWFVRATDGSRTAQLMGIAWGAAGGSAIVDNIPFTATMVPLVQGVQEMDGITRASDDPGMWWALAAGACFGGNATIVAAAANVAAAGLMQRSGRPFSFVGFLTVGLPVTVVSMLLATVYLLLRYS